MATIGAQGRPPSDPKATRTADLVELVKLDPAIKLDIRYAGTNNFLGKPVYRKPARFSSGPRPKPCSPRTVSWPAKAMA